MYNNLLQSYYYEFQKGKRPHLSQISIPKTMLLKKQIDQNLKQKAVSNVAVKIEMYEGGGRDGILIKGKT